MISSTRLLGTCALSLAATGAASAQDASATLRVRSMAAMCASCHGTDGHAVAGATVPGLAGAPPGYIAQQMKAFVDGTRPATVMQQIARGYTEAQVAQLAAWFEAQPRDAKP